MNDLAPCLFCNSRQPERYEIESDAWAVVCLDCQATGPSRRTEALAVAAWNRLACSEPRPVSEPSDCCRSSSAHT